MFGRFYFRSHFISGVHRRVSLPQSESPQAHPWRRRRDRIAHTPGRKEGHLMKFPKTTRERFPAAFPEVFPWQLDKVTPHGTLMSVGLHHGDAKQVYVAARYGEVFGTQDGGESWLEMPLPQGVQHVYALACG